MLFVMITLGNPQNSAVDLVTWHGLCCVRKWYECLNHHAAVLAPVKLLYSV